MSLLHARQRSRSSSPFVGVTFQVGRARPDKPLAAWSDQLPQVSAFIRRSREFLNSCCPT